MIIRGIEPPQLKIQSKRSNGYAFYSTYTSRMNALVIHDDDWHKVPMKLFECVVLSYCLNYAENVEDMRSMISDAKERLDPGGYVVAVARAFDNGQELAERMARSGVQDLGLTNLSNREVAALSPLSAVLLSDVSVFRPADPDCMGHSMAAHAEARRFFDWATTIRRSPHEADIRFEPEKVTTRVTDIGLTWQK